jgi:hypothetical protein
MSWDSLTEQHVIEASTKVTQHPMLAKPKKIGGIKENGSDTQGLGERGGWMSEPLLVECSAPLRGRHLIHKITRISALNKKIIRYRGGNLNSPGLIINKNNIKIVSLLR